MRRWLAGLIGASVLVGCTPPGIDPPPDAPTTSAQPPEGVIAVDADARALAQALTRLDLSSAPLRDPATAQDELATIMDHAGGLKPSVEVTGISYGPEKDQAKATLSYSWPVDISTWKYETSVDFTISDGKWLATFKPSTVHPELTDEQQLSYSRQLPRRAAINDSDSLALVEQLTMYQVGLDKGAIEPSSWEASARHVAELVDVDVESFVQKVRDGGERQFVVAKTMAQTEIPASISDVPGGHVAETERMVPFSPTFAIGVLGTSGPATAEVIEESQGRIQQGDLVGLSGLQARYDEQLRGVPEIRITATARAGVDPAPDAVELFVQDASVGTPLDLTLDRDLQIKAEEILKDQPGLASLVVIRPLDGALLVAANSPSAGEYPQATFGRFAPGSTFKVASALAMLRDGMTPSSIVQCPASVTIGGKTIGNYSGYPSSQLGAISLTSAFAHSCNTAFASAGAQITPDEIKNAAGSLGIGIDYDAGFTSNFGQLDPQDLPLDRAATMYGQSQVTMSPLGMAAVAASVAAGKTVIPYLVKGHHAQSTALPLTAQEAGELQEMMRATVSSGSGQVLQAVMDGAKTGTAEFGEAGKQQTHAWMIAWNSDYAVAAFVEVGESGSASAAPLIMKLFS